MTKSRKRVKTVELVIEEVDWQSPTHLTLETVVGVRLRWGEAEIASRVKCARGTWNRKTRLWEVRYDRAVQLGLQDRIERGI